MTLAVYPGSFDPVTNGHLDIASRAASIFDQVVMAVYEAPPKNLLFTTEERVALIREATSHLANVRAESFSGLVVEYARRLGAKAIIRGLRMSSDFEREFEMALMNKNLAHEVEVVCLMSRLEYQFLSASLLKEVASLGGNVHNLVPPNVAQALAHKIALLKAKKGG